MQDNKNDDNVGVQKLLLSRTIQMTTTKTKNKKTNTTDIFFLK